MIGKVNCVECGKEIDSQCEFAEDSFADCECNGCQAPLCEVCNSGWGVASVVLPEPNSISDVPKLVCGLCGDVDSVIDRDYEPICDSCGSHGPFSYESDV